MSAQPRGGSFQNSAFARYFAGVSVSAFGAAVTAVALPVFVVEALDADAFELGVVNAAQFVPYALLGLFAGVYVDRWRRQRVLVWASLGRAASLALIPLFFFAGVLELWLLVALLLLFGCFSVFGFAATQSLLPLIVERRALRAANARLDQAEAAAQTAGPALGGALVGWIGAPLAIAVNAITYVVDAVVIAIIRLEEEVRERTRERSLRREIVEGVRWVYRHRVLAPMAWSTHVWFFANAAALTVLAVFALRFLGFTPLQYGLLFAGAGVANLVGASLSAWVGARFGSGPTITAGRALYPLAWGVIAAVPAGSSHESGVAPISMIFAAFAVQGFAGGLENANEMSFRQAVTPNALMGRTNGTMRSVNRSMGALGALAGGAAATLFGVRPTLAGIVAVFAIAFIIAIASPMRAARDDEAPDDDHGAT